MKAQHLSAAWKSVPAPDLATRLPPASASLPAAISEAQSKFEASGLACGDCSAQVEQLVAAQLAACHAREAGLTSGLPGGDPLRAQQQQQPGTSGRSRRRAALAAHAAFAVAAAADEGVEEEEEAAGAGTARRRTAHQQQQQQAGSPGSDLENMVGPASQLAGGPAASGKRVGGPGPPGSAAQHKLALQPTQAASGSSKRQRM